MDKSEIAEAFASLKNYIGMTLITQIQEEWKYTLRNLI